VPENDRGPFTGDLSDVVVSAPARSSELDTLCLTAASAERREQCAVTASDVKHPAGRRDAIEATGEKAA
jgi:hypothetical protein